MVGFQKHALDIAIECSNVNGTCVRCLLITNNGPRLFSHQANRKLKENRVGKLSNFLKYIEMILILFENYRKHLDNTFKPASIKEMKNNGER